MLYHCFPRRPYRFIEDGRPLTEGELKLGLNILESILRFGLLLKPEDAFSMDLGEQISGNRMQSFAHPRCCFTENTLEENLKNTVPFSSGLRNHFDIFGCFAIGIKNSAGRRLGINPCNYYYRTPDELDDPGIRALSEHLLECLHQLRNTLVVLSEVESIANPNDDYPRSGNAVRRTKLSQIGVDYHGETGDVIIKVKKRLSELTEKQAKSIDKLISNTHYPYWYLVQQITFLIHLFQNADSRENRRELAYYTQREWRLVRFFHGNLKFLPITKQAEEVISVNAEEKDIIDEFIDASEAIAERMSGEFKRKVHMDGSWLLFSVGEHHVREFISEIIVPEKYFDIVENSVRKLESKGRFGLSAPTVISNNVTRLAL